MILTEKNGASFFQFANLAQFARIRHGIFTRNSGFSTSPFQSLNVTFGLGDDKNNVKKNRKRIAQCVEGDDLVFAHQVHGDQILLVDGHHDANKNSAVRQPLIGDAMVTHIARKFLVTQVADCQSVLMFDPVRQVVANVHCGWRGSIKNIVGRNVGFMKNHFGCTAGDIVAGIGPSLGPCCAEFINYRTEIPEEFWPYKDARHHFDFWSISTDQLLETGVSMQNIESSQMCTRCNTDLFYSYRGEGDTGRFAGVIGLR